jgi:hypothetical protein
MKDPCVSFGPQPPGLDLTGPCAIFEGETRVPWLILRWILEDRIRPVAASILVRRDLRLPGMRLEAGDGASDVAPDAAPPPRVYLRRSSSQT